MVSSFLENHSPVFFSLFCASFLSKNVCRKQAATGRFTDFIVSENKRFVLLLVQQQTAKSAAEFIANVLTGKRSGNQRKKIQGCHFLLNWRPHAKIQLIWTKFDLEWLCCDVFNCYLHWTLCRTATLILNCVRIETVYAKLSSNKCKNKVSRNSLNTVKNSKLYIFELKRCFTSVQNKMAPAFSILLQSLALIFSRMFENLLAGSLGEVN